MRVGTVDGQDSKTSHKTSPVSHHPRLARPRKRSSSKQCGSERVVSGLNLLRWLRVDTICCRSAAGVPRSKSQRAVDAAAVILRETLGLDVSRALQVAALAAGESLPVRAACLLKAWGLFGACRPLPLAQVSSLHITVYPRPSRRRSPCCALYGALCSDGFGALQRLHGTTH